MQMNYESASLSHRGLVLRAPVPLGRVGSARKPARATGPACEWTKARRALRHAQSWENAAWLTLALGSLAALVVSLWF